jgi:glutathione peroxidase
MKRFIFFVTTLFFAFGITTFSSAQSLYKGFYGLTFNTINGEKYDFSNLKGKYVLIVNTASKCGYTPQFADLENLYKEYGGKLVILGFPSNDFGSQDPGTNNEINDFCKVNYGVTFTMMEKSQVKGKDKNPVFQWLTDKSLNGINDKEPSWNFCKYLINDKGELLSFFPSKIKPGGEEIASFLKELKDSGDDCKDCSDCCK